MLILAWSGVRPYDRLTWLLEVLPVLIVLPVLFATLAASRSPPALRAIFVHALVLMVGGHYTYARVPLGFAIAGAPRRCTATPTTRSATSRRASCRRSRPGRSSSAAATSGRARCSRSSCSRRPRDQRLLRALRVGLGVALGQGADEFLGTQGDPWDTQSDMFFALLGGAAALLTLSRIHDRQIGALQGRENFFFFFFFFYRGGMSELLMERLRPPPFRRGDLRRTRRSARTRTSCATSARAPLALRLVVADGADHGHRQLRGNGLWAVVSARPEGGSSATSGPSDPEAGHGFATGWALAGVSWGKGYAFEGSRRPCPTRSRP